MRSRVSRSATAASALACAALVALAAPASADTIVQTGRAVHGRIAGMTPTGITFQPECDAKKTETIDWASVKDVLFSSSCKPVSRNLRSAGGEICSQAPVRRLAIFVKGRQEPVYGDFINWSGGANLQVEDHANAQNTNLKKADVQGIGVRFVCPDLIKPAALDQKDPERFCVEPRQWAVNFSYDRPLANPVLTRGVGFYFEPVDRPASLTDEALDKLRADIRTGFGNALTMWPSEIWRTKTEAPKPVADYLETLVGTSGSGGYKLFTPPQAVALQCPQSASFVVRAYFQKKGPFAPGKPRKAAYAQLPGQTILLNLADYPCWVATYDNVAIDPSTRCINASAIFGHELGHAFGLVHSNDPESLMVETIARAHPAASDLRELSAQLARSIEADAPGVFTFTSDNGVAVR